MLRLSRRTRPVDNCVWPCQVSAHTSLTATSLCYISKLQERCSGVLSSSIVLAWLLLVTLGHLKTLCIAQLLLTGELAGDARWRWRLIIVHRLCTTLEVGLRDLLWCKRVPASASRPLSLQNAFDVNSSGSLVVFVVGKQLELLFRALVALFTSCSAVQALSVHLLSLI